MSKTTLKNSSLSYVEEYLGLHIWVDKSQRNVFSVFEGDFERAFALAGSLEEARRFVRTRLDMEGRN